MITPINHNVSHATAGATAPVKHGPAVQPGTTTFGKVLRNEKPPVSSPAVDSGGRRLGPFAADTVFGPANPPTVPANPRTATGAPTVPGRPAVNSFASPQEVAALPSGLINFTNRAMHEETMNSWLERSIQAQNDYKMQIYSQAVVNWKLNEARYHELGLPVPPQPQPPVLDVVAPMPKGWWFEDTRA